MATEYLAPLRTCRQCRTIVSTSSKAASRPTSSARANFASVSVAVAAAAVALAASAYTTRPLHLEAPPSLAGAAVGSGPVVVNDSNSEVRIDPSTKQPFPVKLTRPTTLLPASCGDLVLVGLGVRTVSFLRVQVYVAGLYVDEGALARLKDMPGWKDYQKQRLLDPKSNASKDVTSTTTSSNTEKSGEELVASLLDAGVPCLIRIVPVRSTDFAHLRDGFTRSIQARIKQARKAKLLIDEEGTESALSESLQALKEAFPRASLPKGQALDLVFAPHGSKGHSLTLEQDGKVLGSVLPPGEGRSEEMNRFSVARQLLLAYMADKDEISKPFKQSVAEGFEKYA